MALDDEEGNWPISQKLEHSNMTTELSSNKKGETISLLFNAFILATEKLEEFIMTCCRADLERILLELKLDSPYGLSIR